VIRSVLDNLAFAAMKKASSLCLSS